MKLKRFKEENKKKIGIIIFTITCILLISGVLLYRTFAIFETNDEFNIINGTIEDEGNIRFMVYVDNELQKSVPNKESGYSLDTSTSYCENGEVVSWNDEKWSVEIKGVSTTKTKCYLYFKEIYVDETLKQTDGSIGPIPDLGNGRLIPVTISNSEKPTDVNYEGASPGGKVRKADITTSWYSYGEHRWANAIILKDGEVDHYKPGDEIQESAIESYFVWIPRYKYQLKESESTYNSYSGINQNLGEKENNDGIPNKGSNNPYEIIFETKDKGLSTGNQQGEYITHPAFVAFNSNGMWVGKFETGYNQNNDKTNVMPTNSWNEFNARQNIQNPSKIIVKPNVFSWREIQVGNAFYTSYNYIRDLESHMMKNTEWGAIFYLTYSKYGTCNDNSCTELRINNSFFITGYSSSKDPTCGYTQSNETCNQYEATGLNKDGVVGWSYYNSSSQVASTTGNYYGVFDMSGGSVEYVMGVMQSNTDNVKPATGSNSTNNSGFKGPYSNENGENTEGLEWPSKKYYDLYDNDSLIYSYQRGKLGDATKELGPFYSIQYSYNTRPGGIISSYFADLSNFGIATSPWFIRGGTYDHGSEAGIGAFDVNTGTKVYYVSFRIILMP